MRIPILTTHHPYALQWVSLWLVLTFSATFFELSVLEVVFRDHISPVANETDNGSEVPSLVLPSVFSYFFQVYAYFYGDIINFSNIIQNILYYRLHGNFLSGMDARLSYNTV